MEKGIRQSFYMKTLPAMKKVAEEDHSEINGSALETMFWNMTISDDPDLRNPIIMYYMGEITFKNCLDWILRNIAYDTRKISKENLEFIRVIRAAIGGSDWISEEQDAKHETGDYSLKNRASYFDSAFDVLDNILFHINVNRQYVQDALKTGETNFQPWTLPIVDQRYKEVLSNPASYKEESIKKIEFQIETLKKTFEGKISPGNALELIIAYWGYLWPFSGTYEAVEYCLLLSKDIKDNEQLRKQLRNFAIRKTEEEKIQNQELDAKTMHDAEMSIRSLRNSFN